MDKNDRSKFEVIPASLSQPTINWQRVLADVISCFGRTTGTIHFLDGKASPLKSETQMGIPAFLIPKLTGIPIGKGMAGIAAERRQPVEMCNLQTDSSGVARPAARGNKGRRFNRRPYDP